LEEKDVQSDTIRKIPSTMEFSWELRSVIKKGKEGVRKSAPIAQRRIETEEKKGTKNYFLD